MSDNIFVNANIEQGILTPWSGTNLEAKASSSSDIPASCPTAYSLYLPVPASPATFVEAFGASFIDVTPGERYRVTLLGAAKSGSAYRLRLGARQFDGARGSISGYNGGDLGYTDNPSSAWTTYSTILTIAPNVYYLSLGFRLDPLTDGSFSGAFAATLLRAERLRDFVSAPAALLSAPRVIRSSREGYSLRDFDSKSTDYQYLKDPNAADFAQLFQDAVNSGEKIVIPNWPKYRINSFPARRPNESGIITASGVPIDIEGENHPIIEVGEYFIDYSNDGKNIDGRTIYGKFGDGLFRFTGGTEISSISDLSASSYNSVRVPFSLRGLRFNGSSFTNAYIARSDIGEGGKINNLNMIDISQFISPVVENCRLFGGYVAPNATRPIGTGRMDSGLTLHGNVGEQVRGVWIEGFADLGIYGSGIWMDSKNKSPATLTVQSNSKIVTVNLQSHGLTNGAIYGIFNQTAQSGGDFKLDSSNWIIYSGQYEVSVTNPDTFTFNSGTNNTNPAPTTTGTLTVVKDAMVFTNAAGDSDPILSSPAALVQGCVIKRCTNAISYKRQAQGFTIFANHIEDVENGIRSASVGGATYATRASIINNRLYRVSANPIAAVGESPLIDGNRIKNFGKNPVSKLNTAVSLSVSAINLVSANRGHVVNNTIIINDFWRSGIPGNTGNNVVGIKLEKDKNYTDSFYDNIIGFNIIDGCYMPIQESADGFRNDFNFNKIKNNTVSATYGGVASNGSVVR